MTFSKFCCVVYFFLKADGYHECHSGSLLDSLVRDEDIEIAKIILLTISCRNICSL
jgi:hypothetical protein